MSNQRCRLADEAAKDAPRVTEAQVDAALRVTRAVADAIRELGSVASGHLYAHVMSRMDLQTYERIVDTLVRAGVVRRDGSHTLTWVGR